MSLLKLSACRCITVEIGKVKDASEKNAASIYRIEE
jgi:hypothetical protein